MSITFSAEEEPDRLRIPRRLAVLGSPIGHSRSPLLHRTAYAALGLPWEYDAHEVTADALPGFLAELTEPWRGLSLTMPLKEAVIDALDSVDTVGKLTGAVNTVLVTFHDGTRQLAGFNTDVYGMVTALGRAGVASARRALVLGGGATARSAVVAAAQLGAERVDIAVRTPGAAGAVVETARAAGLESAVHALDPAALAQLASDLTISTLPGGVGAEQLFAIDGAPVSSTLLDVAYHPWPSPLAELWQASGSTAVSGLDMLVHQAIAQIRVFVHGDPLIPLTDEPRLTAALLDAAGTS